MISLDRRIYWLVLFLLPSIFLAVLIIYPFISLIGRFPGNLEVLLMLGNSISSQLASKAMYNSLLQGGLGAGFSFAAGVPLGISLGRYSYRYRRALRSMIILPFFLPSVVVVVAFESFFHMFYAIGIGQAVLAPFASGLGGITLINVFFNAPLVAFLVSIALERADRSLEESAKTLGAGTLRLFSSVWGRNGLLAGVTGALLAFLYSFAGFTAPLMIGGQGNYTFEVLIYTMVGLGNPSLAVALSVLQSVILIFPVLLYSLVWSRESRVTAGALSATGEGTGIPYRASMAYIVIFIMAEFTVIAALVVSSVDYRWNWQISLNSYYQLFSNTVSSRLNYPAFQPLINMLFYGASATVIVTAIGMLWITGKRRLRIKPDSPVDIFQFIPLVVPSVVMAFSVLLVAGNALPPSYTWILIILVQAAVGIPIVLRVISSGFMNIPDTMWEAASTLKGNAFFEVELPMAGTTLATALMFGFAISIGEFTATNFLSTYSSSIFVPLGVEIYQLQGLRLFSVSYAAASVLLIFSVIFFYLIQVAGDRFIALR